MNNMLNLAWNMAEWMASPKEPVDILWLYAGWVNNSMAFNVVEFILSQIGVIK